MNNYKHKVCMVIGFISLIIFILISIVMMCKGIPNGDTLFLAMVFFGWILPLVGACIDKSY